MTLVPRSSGSSDSSRVSTITSADADGPLAPFPIEIDEGPEPTQLFLSHATGFCKEVWRPVTAEARKRGFRGTAVAWDFGSHGRAPKLDHPIDWWDFGRQVVAVADHLEAAGSQTGPRVGVGHSMGSAALVMAQMLRPALFDALVLIEPITPPPPHRRLPADNPMSTVAAKRRPAFDSRESALDNFRSKPVFAAWDPRALEAYIAGGLREAGDRWELSCTPADEAEVYRGSSAHAAFDRLGELRGRVVLVVGEHSDTHQAAFVDALRRQMPGAEIVEASGASHFVPMEQPDRVAAIIDDVVEGLTR